MNGLKEFGKIIGWQSALIALLALLIIRVSIVLPFYQNVLFISNTALSPLYYLVFAFGFVFLVIAGNVVCFYFDRKMNLILQAGKNINMKDYPEESKLYRMYVVFAVLGMGLVIYSCIMTHCYQIASLALVYLLSAYFYALKYKREFLSGNLVLSLMYALIIATPVLYEFYALMKSDYNAVLNIFSSQIQETGYIFLFFTIFTFILTFIRDVVGDLTNMESDRKSGFTTLAVKVKDKTLKTVLNVLAALLIIAMGVFLWEYYMLLEPMHVIMIAIIVVLPLVYAIIQLYKATKQEDYNFVYTLYGVVFVSLLFTLTFVKNIYINAQSVL